MSAAAIPIAGAVAGSLISGAMSKKAGNTAAAAQNTATSAQQGMFNTVNEQGAPQRQAGYNALADIAQGFGQPNPGPGTGSGSVPFESFIHQFDANDLKTNLAPNYQFQLQQGQGAATNALNLTGGLGGNFAQGLNKFTQDYAGGAYQQAYNNYTANQQNIFNRLSTIAGFGNTANSTVAGSANAISPGIASTIGGAGQARAAGTVGLGNALGNAAQTAGSWYGLDNFLNPSPAIQNLGD